MNERDDDNDDDDDDDDDNDADDDAQYEAGEIATAVLGSCLHAMLCVPNTLFLQRCLLNHFFFQCYCSYLWTHCRLLEHLDKHALTEYTLLLSLLHNEHFVRGWAAKHLQDLVIFFSLMFCCFKLRHALNRVMKKYQPTLSQLTATRHVSFLRTINATV